VCALGILAAVACVDKVALSGTSGNPNGLLVDGQESSGQVNDSGFVSTNNTIPVGKLASGTSNEVTAFTSRRPVAFTSAPWTSGTDNIPVPFASEIQIPVTVWIVQGPFNTQRARAIDASITTTGIWRSERMGVAFAPFQIVDATADPDASSYYDFTCAQQNGIETDIGQTAGRINIYYVDTVDSGTGRGQACSIGSDFVAMGSNTGNELLSHELGHDFWLSHVNALVANFNQTNVMHSASNTRQFLSEGELFRAHLANNSALNFLYAARPGEPTRDCPRDTANLACPTIQRRLWADGTFPSN
jgi:hypothetical protein